MFASIELSGCEHRCIYIYIYAYACAQCVRARASLVHTFGTFIVVNGGSQRKVGSDREQKAARATKGHARNQVNCMRFAAAVDKKRSRSWIRWRVEGGFLFTIVTKFSIRVYLKYLLMKISIRLST